MSNTKSTSAFNHDGASFAGANQQQLGPNPKSLEKKAPDMAGEFKHVSQTPAPHDIEARYRHAKREAFKVDRRVHQTPVTRDELDARKEARATPKTVMQLAPGGAVKQMVDSRVEAENERRIHFIQKRLNRVHGKAREAFDKER